MIKVYSPKERSLSKSELECLYEIVRIAYAETEEVMFGKNYIRISFDDFKEFVERGDMFYALLNDEVVGGIRHYHVDSNTYSFGLLAADFNHSGKGIGNALIQRVEEEANKKGVDYIQIEILRPLNEEVSIKNRISAWYQRLGYQSTVTLPLEEVNKQKAQETIVPCAFDYYKKQV